MKSRKAPARTLVCPGCAVAFESHHGLQLFCTQACAKRTKARERYRRNPGYGRKNSRRHTLKKHYGLTLGDYEAMYAAQSGRCAICDMEYESLVVDHDHKTGAVRALLCITCNWVLGQAKDDPVLLVRAAGYLTKHWPDIVGV